MKRNFLIFITPFLILMLVTPINIINVVNVSSSSGGYEPTWESLDSHQTPQWFEDAKFGLFIHWGVYSVPAWAPVGQYAEWYWYHMKKVGSPTWKYHREHYGENFTYDDFIPMFKAENYNPEEWVKIAKDTGMKYIVITTKHHDGFCLWPSKYTTRDAGDMGPKRDLIGPLVKAARKYGLKIGFYYSLLDWSHPDYPGSKYIEYAHNQVKELVSLYHPDMLWFDGEWDYPPDFWRIKELVAWYYNQAENPDEVCVNDRLGKGTRGIHGDFATLEYEVANEILPYKWEACRGIGYSFGYNRNEKPEDYMTAKEIIELLVDIVSKNGNLLLNVGPKADGTFPEVQKERLKEVGKWLRINGEAIYNTRPWLIAEEGNMHFTKSKDSDTVYVIFFEWPDKELIIRSIKVGNHSKVRMLGIDEKIEWYQDEEGLKILMPSKKPCEYAYVLKIEHPISDILLIGNLMVKSDVVEAGSPLEISVDITNPSKEQITRKADLTVILKWRGLIQKKFTESVTLTLEPGETKTYTFTLVINDPGSYELQVENMRVNFEVISPAEAPETFQEDFLKMLGITMIAIAFIIMAGLVTNLILKRKG